MGDDIDVLLLTSVKEMLEKNEIKPQTKSKSKISNLNEKISHYESQMKNYDIFKTENATFSKCGFYLSVI